MTIEANSPIAIEETANGYIVRPLGRSREASVGRDAVVLTSLDDLSEWLIDHFKARVCPGCGRVADRSDYFFYTGETVLRCRKCHKMSIDGSDRWIDLDPARTYESEEVLAMLRGEEAS